MNKVIAVLQLSVGMIILTLSTSGWVMIAVVLIVIGVVNATGGDDQP